MPTFFKTLIEQGFALFYIDDILLLSDSKEHIFQHIEHLHIISTRNILKLAPEKSFFMLLKVQFLGHEIGYNAIKPIHSKIKPITSETKRTIPNTEHPFLSQLMLHVLY